MASSGLPTILFLIVSLRAAWAGGRTCWEPPWRRCLGQDSRSGGRTASRGKPHPPAPINPTMGPPTPTAPLRWRGGDGAGGKRPRGVHWRTSSDRRRGVALPVLLRCRRAVELRLVGLA